jgi:hypothetical protein
MGGEKGRAMTGLVFQTLASLGHHRGRSLALVLQCMGAAQAPRPS